MTYRGEVIEAELRLDVRPPFPTDRTSQVARWTRWFSRGGIATPSLRSVLTWIDYELAGVPLESEKLKEWPVGRKCGVSWNEFDWIKADIQHEHEDAGNWFVNVHTGKVLHRCDFAALRRGFVDRWTIRNQPDKEKRPEPLTITAAARIVLAT